jgi:hypothetical protein
MAYLDGSFTERVSVVDQLAPLSQGAATVNGAAVDMLYFSRLMYILKVGVVSTGTVDFKLQGSVNGTSGWTDLTGKAITQITASTKIVKVGVVAEDLQGGGYRYVRSVLTAAVAASLVDVTALATCGAYKPEASFNQIAAVTQTIADKN